MGGPRSFGVSDFPQSSSPLTPEGRGFWFGRLMIVSWFTGDNFLARRAVSLGFWRLWFGNRFPFLATRRGALSKNTRTRAPGEAHGPRTGLYWIGAGIQRLELRLVGRRGSRSDAKFLHRVHRAPNLLGLLPGAVFDLDHLASRLSWRKTCLFDNQTPLIFHFDHQT